jgi:D-alanyl-D-alanine carboxypeptidase
MMRAANKDYYDARVTGGRTGALSTTDRSLICTAQQGGSRYLSVVMSASGTVTNDPNIVDKYGSYEEMKQLLDHGFEKFSVFNLMLQDHAMAQFNVVNGENKVSVGPDQTVRVSLPNHVMLSDVTYRCVENGTIQAPVEKGQIVGYIEAWYNGICVAKYDLLAMHDVKTASEGISQLPLTYEQPAQNDTVKDISVWILILVLFAVAVLGVMILIKRVRSSMERKRIRNALRGVTK